MGHRFSAILVLGFLAVAAPACVRVNASHCGNQDGNVTCSARGGAAVYCNVCVADNDGCVVAEPSPQCRADAQTAATEGSSVTSAETDASDTATSSTDSGPGSSTMTEPDVATCGNGVVEPPEECDGEGTLCAELGAGTGEAPCGKDCHFDTRGCSSPPDCGNTLVEPGEACEPGFDPELDCEDVSSDYVGGELACTGDCTYDFSQCIACTGMGPLEECTPGSCCPGTTCECALEICRCREP